MTKKQREALWKARDIGFEQGMIEGWTHIVLLSRSCIRAHKKTLKQLMSSNARNQGLAPQGEQHE